MNRFARNACAAAVGLLLDRVLGEPPNNVHPVALFGTAMSRLETHLWTDNRNRGVLYTATGTAVGLASGRLVRSTAIAVAVAAAGRQLRQVGSEVAGACAAEDLTEARRLLPSLVGRDPSQLDESGIAAAVIESLAENSVDAVVAPVFWGVIAGAPGALAYRTINTMDAMVGHKSDRYLNFGWSSARLDDIANLVPARVFYRLVQVVAGQRRAEVQHAVRTTAAMHPSPNAGVAEAAVAGALGIELGGPLRYGDRLENRPALGSGPRPTRGSMTDAIDVVDRAEQLLVALLLGFAGVSWIVRQR